MFAGLLFGIVLTMWLFPDLPISRAMHRAFVADPLALMARMTRTHLIFAVVALAMSFSFAELILILGSSDIIMLMAWDVSLYVDAVIATWTIAAMARLKGFWLALKTRIVSPFRRLSRPRPPRRRPAEVRKPANDGDADPAGYALAA